MNRRGACLPLLALAACAAAGSARAQEGGGSCALATVTLSFGTVNPQATGTIYTSGTATITCTGLAANATVAACLSIGAGSASGSTATARVLSASGTSTRIPITLVSTPGASQQIGNGTSFPKEGPVTFAANASGQAAATFPLTVALTGPLAATPATYSNAFTSTNFRATYRTPSSASCSSITTNASGGQLTVQAVVVPGCTVTATPLNFGAASVLGGAVNATSTVRVTCTAGVSATVGLDNGQYGGAPTARLIKAGTFTIRYGIYQNAARTVPWGATSGVDTVPLVLGASPVSLTAYGLVPAQTTPPAGTYTDVVNVSVVY